MKRVLTALLLTVPALLAHGSEYPTDAELKTLPSFCMVKSKMRGTPQERAEIAKYGGENWAHIHHYCAALANVDRARKATSAQQAMVYLQIAAGQYEYVNGGFAPTFWMRPQLYLEYGNVRAKLKQHGEAVRLLGEAVRLSPTYLVAYLSLIDTYKALDMKPAALEAASTGLRNIPGSPALQKVYLDLGGKKPFPEPAQAGDHQAVTPAATAPKETDTAEAPSAAAETSTSAGAAPSATAGEAPEGSVERGCRFCPPEEIQKKWRESFGGAPRQ